MNQRPLWTVISYCDSNKNPRSQRFSKTGACLKALQTTIYECLPVPLLNLLTAQNLFEGKIRGKLSSLNSWSAGKCRGVLNLTSISTLKEKQKTKNATFSMQKPKETLGTATGHKNETPTFHNGKNFLGFPNLTYDTLQEPKWKKEKIRKSSDTRKLWTLSTKWCPSIGECNPPYFRAFPSRHQ